MRIKKPSPALVVAIVALVMACGGSAVAAIDYARNAGAVDHLSAVKAGASLHKAKGRLVATKKKGSHRGQIPAKFLDLSGTAQATSFALGVPVTDNATGGANVLNTSGFGRLTMACNDQSTKKGVENPTSRIAFTSTYPNALNVAHQRGADAPVVKVLQPNTVDEIVVNGSNTFRFHVEYGGVDVVYEGIVRQVGANTPDASCLAVGTAETVSPQ